MRLKWQRGHHYKAPNVGYGVLDTIEVWVCSTDPSNLQNIFLHAKQSSTVILLKSLNVTFKEFSMDISYFIPLEEY